VSLKKKRILDLVEENYVFASVLHYFGIGFYDFSESKFSETCIKKGLKSELIVDGLEDVIEEDQEHFLYLMSLPIEVVICYLKHKHYSFIKHSIPYLAKLIHNYPTSKAPSIINEIRIKFPVFVKGFIEHMHKEEYIYFKLIEDIDGAIKGSINFSKLFFTLKKSSIKKMAEDHTDEDDIMFEIRNITDDYKLKKDSPVLLKVIYSELQSFEKNLIIHSRIENEVLFPKAILLEKEVYKIISKRSYLN
jgi:regulator of cell morphogenesis and NO signaling